MVSYWLPIGLPSRHGAGPEFSTVLFLTAGSSLVSTIPVPQLFLAHPYIYIISLIALWN